MALINIITNTASIEFKGALVNSNAVSTSLSLAPTIVKSVDKIIASVGEVLTYTIVITNISLIGIKKLPFTDILAEGIVYVKDSFTLNREIVTPVESGNTLNYVIEKLDAAGVATITFQANIIG